MRLPERLVLPPRQRDHPYDRAPIGAMRASGGWDPDAPEAEPGPAREPVRYPPADYLCLGCVLARCTPRDRRCLRRADRRRSVNKLDARTQMLLAIRDLSARCEKVSGATLARYLQRGRCAVYLVLTPAIADGLVVRRGHRLSLTDAGRAALVGLGSERCKAARGKERRPGPVLPVPRTRSRIRISSIL